MAFTPSASQQLKKILPRDYRHQIANKIGCHPNLVYLVLHKGHSHLEIEKLILELAEETHKKHMQLNKRASNLKLPV